MTIKPSLEKGVQLSIVTTAHNEAGNVEPFLVEAFQALGELGVTGEIIYIDDGSQDGTGDAVLDFAEQHPEAPIRLVRHNVRRGISAAIEEASALSMGDLVCFLPADLESSPATDVPLLYRALDEQTDVVVGSRKDRNDGKVFASALYRLLTRWLFGVRVRDGNWIKLVRRDKLQGLTLRSDWHRFLLPILVHRGCRVKEIVTQWHPRTYGRSKFGFKRFPVAISDLVSLRLFLSFGQRPMLFFLGSALLALLLGTALAGASFVVDEEQPRLWSLFQVLAAACLATSFGSLALGWVVDLLLVARSQRGGPA